MKRPVNSVGTILSSAILNISPNTPNYEVYYFEPTYDECKNLVSSIIILGKIEQNPIGAWTLTTLIHQDNVCEEYGISVIDLQPKTVGSNREWVLNICIGTNYSNKVRSKDLKHLTNRPSKGEKIQIQVSDNNVCPPVGARICNGKIL